MEKVAGGRRRKARRGRERESWSEVGVRARLGVNYISVCWHVAQPFLPMYMFGYERVRANEQGKLRTFGRERKDENGRGEEGKRRENERRRAINERFGAPLARCPFYHILPLTLPSIFLLPLSNLEIPSASGPTRISHS